MLWLTKEGQGPLGPSRPAALRRLDLAPHLCVGTNVGAVLVTYYGRAMSFWQPALDRRPPILSADCFLGGLQRASSTHRVTQVLLHDDVRTYRTELPPDSRALAAAG